MLPPQLLGLNLDPEILRSEHSQLVEGVVWDCSGRDQSGTLSPGPIQTPGIFHWEPQSLRLGQGRRQAWLVSVRFIGILQPLGIRPCPRPSKAPLSRL